jgi:hypothetical protein
MSAAGEKGVCSGWKKKPAAVVPSGSRYDPNRYGVCPGCGRDMRLTKAGRLVWHYS